jgi:hypothetical protein
MCVNTDLSDVNSNLCSLLTWKWLVPKLKQTVLIKSAVFERMLNCVHLVYKNTVECNK